MALFGVYAETIAMYSLIGNMTVAVILFVSGIGRRVLLRMRQRLLHRRGGYANTLLVAKNGTASEVFKKVGKDKSLDIDEGKYTIDRRKTILLDGIPTMLHFEGLSEPKDWNDPENSMSTGELQQIIENNKREGIVEMLKQYFPIAVVLVVLVLVLAGASLYFNWQIYDSLVQSAGAVIPAGRP